MVERFREQFTTEKLADRLARIVADAEATLSRAASPPLLPLPSRSQPVAA